MTDNLDLTAFLNACDAEFAAVGDQAAAEGAAAEAALKAGFDLAIDWLMPLLPEAVVPFTNFDLPNFSTDADEDRRRPPRGCIAEVTITLPGCAPVVTWVVQRDPAHPPVLQGNESQTAWSVLLYVPNSRPRTPDDVKIGYESFDSLEFAVGYAHWVKSPLEAALEKTRENFALRQADTALHEQRFPDDLAVADSLRNAEGLAADYRFEEAQSLALIAIGRCLLTLRSKS